jgi:hypothetical protein
MKIKRFLPKQMLPDAGTILTTLLVIGLYLYARLFLVPSSFLYSSFWLLFDVVIFDI